MVRGVITGAVLLALGCGGPKVPAGGQPSATDAGVAARTADAEPGADEPAGETALTAAECDRFVDHVVVLAAEMLATEAENPDHANTAEEIATIQDKLRSEMRAECLRVDRATYDCAMEAATAAALQGCQTAGGEGRAPR